MMIKITFLYAALLILLGIGGYLLSGMASWTALIPSIAGVLFLAIGAIATLGDGARKHAMHAAAVIALLAMVGPAMRLAREGYEFTAAKTSMLLMVILTAAYLAASINSFIEARKRRKQDEG